MPRTITYRPITAEDGEFLLRLYAETYGERFALLDMDPQQRQALLKMQFEVQQRHYENRYCGADFLIILADDVPIGRWYVQYKDDEFVAIDVALLREFRTGIGRQVVLDLIKEARAAGKPVRAHVERTNPACKLWVRLGFEIIGGDDVYYEILWSPDRQNKDST